MYLSALPKTASSLPAQGYRPNWAWAVLVLLASNILSLALPLVMLQVYDRILVYAFPGTLNLLCIGAMVAILTESVLRICRAQAIEWSSAAFEHVTTSNLVRHALSIGSAALEKKSSGEFYQLVTGIAKIREIFAGRMLATMIDVPFVIIFLLIIYYLGGGLVWVPIFIIVFMWAGLLLFGGQLSGQLRKRIVSDNKRYGFLIRLLGNVHVAKSLGRERIFERLYQKEQYASSLANYGVVCASANMYDLGLFIIRAIMVLMVGFGFPMVLLGHMSMGALIACVILTGRIIHPVQRGLNFWARLQDAKLANDDLGEFFSISAAFEAKSEPVTPEGVVKLTGVGLVDGFGNTVFDAVDLDLARGDAVAISGGSGDGLRALLRIVSGLEKLTHGRVIIDGVDPSVMSSAELTRHVGYLSPDGKVFRGTIGENLSRFGLIGKDDVDEIAGLLSIDAEISRLPEGYETYLEGGKTDVLSPGLRQRIAIARVLASRPKIVVFDNADRSLDRESYNSVCAFLAGLKGRATLIIASDDRDINALAGQRYVLSKNGLIKADQLKAFGRIDSKTEAGA